MAIMYVAEQGAMLRKKGNMLVAEKKGVTAQSVHIFKLDQVVLLGNISITPSTIAFLLQEGIDTVFMSMYGRYRGRLISEFGKNIILRQAQFQRFGDQAFVLGMARKYVVGKLTNCRTLLRRHNQELKNAEITKSLHAIRNAASRAAESQDIDALRGLEGAGSAAFFSAFRHAIRAKGMSFEKRTRRPPRDRVNALLSFGYSLLANAVQRAVNITGLDPYLGCLHVMDYGRPSLVLDIMEEFRPVIVDSLVLRVVNRQVIKPSDFLIQDCVELPPDGEEVEGLETEDYPVLLTHEAMKKFITQFERRMKEKTLYLPQGKRLSYQDICLEQTRLLARCLKGDEAYQPYLSR